MNPLDAGWEIKDVKFAMVYYDGSQMPETVACDINENNIQDEDDENIYESSGDVSSDDDFIQLCRYRCLLICI